MSESNFTEFWFILSKAPLVCFLTHFWLTYAVGHFEMDMSETNITHKNRLMVLSHLIQARNHELWYSFSLHIILSRKHASTWLDSVNTSLVHFINREDSQDCIWADLLFLGFVQLQEPAEVFTYHNLYTAGDIPLTYSYWKLCCLQLQVSGNLQITSSSIILTLCSVSNHCRCSTDSTVLETTPALSYVFNYLGKKSY